MVNNPKDIIKIMKTDHINIRRELMNKAENKTQYRVNRRYVAI